MSTTVATSIVLENLIILHQDHKGLIYVFTPPGNSFYSEFAEKIKLSIEMKELETKSEEGDISQMFIDGKFVLKLTGRFENIILILNKSPDLVTRQALRSFDIMFSKRWARELKSLNTNPNYDMGCLFQRTTEGESIEDLVMEFFSFLLKNADANNQRIEELSRRQEYKLLRELIYFKKNLS